MRQFGVPCAWKASLIQGAHFLARTLAQRGRESSEVYCNSWCIETSRHRQCRCLWQMVVPNAVDVFFLIFLVFTCNTTPNSTSRIVCQLHYRFAAKQLNNCPGSPANEQPYAQNKLRRDQCGVSARRCTPCALCSSCICLSLCHFVADDQLSGVCHRDCCCTYCYFFVCVFVEVW